LVDDFEASDLALNDFCERRGVSLDALKKAIKRVSQRRRAYREEFMGSTAAVNSGSQRAPRAPVS